MCESFCRRGAKFMEQIPRPYDAGKIIDLACLRFLIRKILFECKLRGGVRKGGTWMSMRMCMGIGRGVEQLTDRSS